METNLIPSTQSSTNSTFFCLNNDYSIHSNLVPDQLVHCYYQEKTFTQGWNYLKIYTSPNHNLLDQHRGAGYIEGYLTYKDIYYCYRNWMDAILNKHPINPIIIQFLLDQIQYIDNLCQANSQELFWQYVKAKMEQLRYMYKGFQARIKKQNNQDFYLTWEQFIVLTNVGDLQDLIPGLQKSTPGYYLPSQQNKNCNAYIKLIEDQLFTTHVTHNHYQFMLRIFKTYHFPTQDQRIGSQTITLSSRPGDLISKDDFYILSSGLRILETTLQNKNDDNWKEMSSRTVPTWIRQTVACHLAKTSQQWIKYYLTQRSGTHNNQWIVIDPKEINNKSKGIVYVEDAFSMYQTIDVTDWLFSQGYVPGFNMPYSKRIHEKLGYLDKNKMPWEFQNQPRFLCFQKYDKQMKSIEDMKKWLLVNEEQDNILGLAPRNDFCEKNPWPYGTTDCKVASQTTIKQNYIWAIAGPPTCEERFPLFDWKKWPNSWHFGMPQVFDFKWVKINIHHPDEIKNIIRK